MNQELKTKILYSNIITDIILTGKVIGIYLGGSRVLSLESSESDYDIIVISKDKSLQCYHGNKLNIPGYKCHIQIGNIKETISSIKSPEKSASFNSSKLLQDLFIIQDNNIIYSTKDLSYLRSVVSKHTKELYTLALENTLNNLSSRLYYPIQTYRKLHYHLLTQYFLFENFLLNNTLGLTLKQKELLKDFKEKRILPPILFEILKKLQPPKHYTSNYNYEIIYEEVKNYE